MGFAFLKDHKNDVKIIKPQLEIIYVKNVKFNSIACKSGLKERDRIISVNNIQIHDKDYKQIVTMIENR
jgi:C-terminal processing protease CtpA/Prc